MTEGTHLEQGRQRFRCTDYGDFEQLESYLIKD